MGKFGKSLKSAFNRVTSTFMAKLLGSINGHIMDMEITLRKKDGKQLI